jgi:hypothetical protein
LRQIELLVAAFLVNALIEVIPLDGMGLLSANYLVERQARVLINDHLFL